MVAITVTGTFFGFDSRLFFLYFNLPLFAQLPNLFYGEDADTGVFRGFGFTYDGGRPTGGTVTSHSIFDGNTGEPPGEPGEFRITGLHLPATSILEAYLTSGRADDRALFRGTLSGNDSFNGGANPEYMNGYGGADTLFGRGGADFLFGGAGDDVLAGGDARDVVSGNAGNDRMVWNPGDDSDVLEGGGGIDTVDVRGGSAGEAFALIVSGGRIQFNGVAPEAFNLNIGTTEKLFLRANGGNDSFSVAGNVAALIGITVDGGAGDDTLGGGNGADLLFGNGGEDILSGGAGNDTYVLGSEASGIDQVDDSSGIDTITSAISRNLSFSNYAEIENLTLVRSSTTTGIGNALANTITGNAAANALNGLAGKDTLIGGAGIDRLTGAAANDVFVLNAPLNPANRDVITDFSNIPGNNDVFHLENAVMTKVGAAGALAANAFFAGAAAHDADDRIVYNQANGALSYDSNGNLAGGVTLLALISNKPALTSADFVVI